MGLFLESSKNNYTLILMRDVRFTMRYDVMYRKAKHLAESGRVEFLGNGRYNVVGDHGTYIVAQDYKGKFSCNCQGYLSKGRCSHIAAVNYLKMEKQFRSR